MGEVVAEFDSAELLVAAAGRIAELGYRRLEAFSPFAVPELDDVLAIRRTSVRWWVLAAGVVGAAVALAGIHFTNAVDQPLDVGGRPLDSWPADVPIAFETSVLFAALAAFAGVLLGSGLPRLHHRLFALDGFERTTVDRFWLLVAGVPAEGDPSLAAELVRVGALAVREVTP